MSPKQTTEGSEQCCLPCCEFLDRTTFLLILLLFIGCPLIHWYSTNSLLSIIIASTRLLLTTLLKFWESISQLANFAHLLILPFSVLPLYADTCLVKGHFLCWSKVIFYAARAVWNTLSYEIRSSNTLSFFKSTLKTYVFQQSYWFCVLGGGERGRERKRTSGQLQNVRVLLLFYCLFFNLFSFMPLALCSKGEMAQKRTHYYYYLLSLIMIFRVVSPLAHWLPVPAPPSGWHPRARVFRVALMVSRSHNWLNT